MTRRDLTPEEVAAALSFVDANDREMWVRMGMAVHDALGNEGFGVWDAWSRTSEKYREASARGAWRLFRPGGGITVGSLIKEARAGGWTPNRTAEAARPRPRPAKPPPAPAPETDPVEVERRVLQMINDSESSFDHPYLVAKGLDGVAVRVLHGKILVPMYDIKSHKPTAVQLIDEDGSKLFAPRGCRVSRSVYRLSTAMYPRRRWWCEGLATGLTVLRALQRISRHEDSVVVCFSAGTIARVARGRDSVVIADHDWWHCGNNHRWDHAARKCPTCGRRAAEPAGERAARHTRLQWWQPPAPGTDANDYVAERGVDVLADELLRLVAGRPILGPIPLPSGAPRATAQPYAKVQTPVMQLDDTISHPIANAVE